MKTIQCNSKDKTSYESQYSVAVSFTPKRSPHNLATSCMPIAEYEPMEIAAADSYHVSIPISLNTRDCGSQKFIRHRTKADELAEQSCQELPLYRAVAINGTPYPASPQYGLRLKVLLRTIKSVAAMGGNPSLERFCSVLQML